MSACFRLICAAALAAAVAQPAWAARDVPRCPTATARNSTVICGNGCDPDEDKARLSSLAKDIVKARRSVCLLALIDPRDAGYSRKLAAKRLLWVREALIDDGVTSGAIALEFRPLPSGQDKVSLLSVGVILDR